MKVLIKIMAVIFGLMSPTITFFLYASGENFELTSEEYVSLTYKIAFCFLISLPIPLLIIIFVKKFLRRLIISVISCSISYALILTISAFYTTENTSEVVMWLPVLIFFAIINYFPMAFLISLAENLLVLRYNQIQL